MGRYMLMAQKKLHPKEWSFLYFELYQYYHAGPAGAGPSPT